MLWSWCLSLWRLEVDGSLPRQFRRVLITTWSLLWAWRSFSAWLIRLHRLVCRLSVDRIHSRCSGFLSSRRNDLLLLLYIQYFQGIRLAPVQIQRPDLPTLGRLFLLEGLKNNCFRKPQGHRWLMRELFVKASLHGIWNFLNTKDLRQSWWCRQLRHGISTDCPALTGERKWIAWSIRCYEIVIVRKSVDEISR